MADDLARKRSARQEHDEQSWGPEVVAQLLVSRRDQLVERLPMELASARGLTHDQRELVVDEAIDYMVTEYPKPIVDRDGLEMAFWATASFRVKRAHEGRGATVRAGWKRLDVADLQIASHEPDPAAALVRRVERDILLEFTATLTETQRQVLSSKFGSGPKVQGRVAVARRLGLPEHVVKRAERAIDRKLHRFAAVMSAGTWCDHLGHAINGLVAGSADDRQETAARLHLRHCPACRNGYVAQLRTIHSGELQRRLAALLPLPPAAEEGRRSMTGAWDAVVDWTTRPFVSESVNTSVQLSAGARGIGTVVTAKLAALCVSGVVAVGGGTYCVTTLLQPDPPRPIRAQPTPTPEPSPKPDESELPPAATLMRAAQGASTQKDSQPTKPRRSESRASGQRTATQHERETAISPPVTQASGAPVQEFGPGPEQTAPSAPAAAPSTGSPEFP